MKKYNCSKEFTKERLLSSLEFLDINQTELCRYLGVDARTVRRWVKSPELMPVAAREAIIAWEKLEKLHYNWRPDGVDLPRIIGLI